MTYHANPIFNPYELRPKGYYFEDDKSTGLLWPDDTSIPKDASPLYSLEQVIKAVTFERRRCAFLADQLGHEGATGHDIADQILITGDYIKNLFKE